jgi:hypothetical protein
MNDEQRLGGSLALPRTAGRCRGSMHCAIIGLMLQIPLPPDVEARLRERAKARGEDVSTLAARLLEDALSTATVDELLAPFRREVEESGISDDELDRFGEELRDEVWRETQGRKVQPQ